MRRLLVLAMLATLFASSSTRADGEPDTIFDAARSAVAANRVVKGKALGGDDPKRSVTDLPDKGALLIGFDVGVGKFLDIESVYALRPLYLTADGEESYQDFGLFADHRVSPKKVLKTKVVKKVRIMAQPGYAVGAITLRTGLNINGLSVTFMRINGRTLGPSQSYTSEWVGDRTGGGEKTVSAAGAPVVGVYGTQDDEHVFGLGLLYVNEPPLPAKPAPEPPRTEKPAPPVTEQRPPKPAPKTKVQPTAPAEKEVEPPPVTDVPAPRPQPAPAPSKPAVPQEASTLTVWMPFLVFGVVVGFIVAAALVFHNVTRRSRTSAALRDPVLLEGSRKALQPRPDQPTIDDDDVPMLTAADEDDVPILTATDEGEGEGVRTDLPALPPTLVPRNPAFNGGRRIACPGCERVIPIEGRPSWCPHCGADLQRDADRTGPAAAPERSKQDTKPFAQPPFFHGKAERTYRIFVLPDELLFLDAPSPNDRGGAENVARGFGLMGGLVGGMIGGAIADSLAAGQQAEARRRRDDLDRAPTDELQEMADAERRSFRAEVASFREASIVALTFWERLFTQNTAARLHFDHADRGRVTLVLPTPADVRQAIEHLSPVLGDKLKVNAVWNYGAERYVPH